MPGYGRTTTNTSGRPVMVLANLDHATWKPGGVTIDWSTVTPASSDTTLDDGTIIPSGQKGIQFGTILTKITASGKFGPYASGASDGRQTLTRGECYILNETVLQYPAGVGMPGQGATDHPAVFDGGLVWKARLGIDPSGTTTKPSTSSFQTAFPRIAYAQD